MTIKRMDGSYRRNSKCPCGSGKKIKKCCSHLLMVVTNSDVEADVRSTNIEANSYVKTTSTLKNLEAPNPDNMFRGKMTCGCCHGSGRRRKHSDKYPFKEMVGSTECESCDGKGWYWVSVSDIIAICAHDSYCIIEYVNKDKTPIKVFNTTDSEAPDHLYMDRFIWTKSSVVEFCGQFTFEYKKPEFGFHDPNLRYIIKLHPKHTSIVTSEQLMFICYFGCIWGSIPNMIKTTVRAFMRDNGFEGKLSLLPHSDIPDKWWVANNRFFVPVITKKEIALYIKEYRLPGKEYEMKSKQYKDYTLVYHDNGDDSFYIVKAEASNLNKSVTREYFDEYRKYLLEVYKHKFKEHVIPPKEVEGV